MGDRLLAQSDPRCGLLPHGRERRQGLNEKIVSLIRDIRDSGLVNTFDIPSVQRMAFESGFYELICFIEDDRAAYVRFILAGEESV